LSELLLLGRFVCLMAVVADYLDDTDADVDRGEQTHPSFTHRAVHYGAT
jgi:hypothetical protein